MITVRHRLRSSGPEEIRWCCRSVGWWFGWWYLQGARGSFRLLFLQRKAIRPRQLGWWWRFHLPIRCGLLPTSSRPERRRWMACYRSGRCLLHPDSACWDLSLPRSSLPYFGSLLPQQMRSEVRVPPHAVHGPMRYLQRTLHRHLQAALSLLLPHPSQGISDQRHQNIQSNCNEPISVHHMTSKSASR